MISVSYRAKDDYVLELRVSGHADFAKSNELDLVCACVSSIVIGGLNQIADDKNYVMTVKSGDVMVNVLKTNTIDNSVIMTIITQLKTLETKYSKNINVKNL